MFEYEKVTPLPWGDADKSVLLIKTSIGWVCFADMLNFRRHEEGTGWIAMNMRDLAKIENELPKRKKTAREKLLEKLRRSKC